VNAHLTGVDAPFPLDEFSPSNPDPVPFRH